MDTIQKASLSTDCTCEYEEATDYYCEGDCHEFDIEQVSELLGAWAWSHGFAFLDGFTVRIDGEAMGWTRASGYLVTDSDNLLAALKINGDYRLDFTLDGETLRVVRYSHDEPTGASFTITATDEEEED